MQGVVVLFLLRFFVIYTGLERVQSNTAEAVLHIQEESSNHIQPIQHADTMLRIQERAPRYVSELTRDVTYLSTSCS
jgi:hypothetical protein